MELVHGTVVLGSEYEGLAGTRAPGRQLDVTIDSQEFEWQTMGFGDVSHMPALQPEMFKIAALVADPHVEPLLTKWKIGWDRVAIDAAPGEVAYDNRCPEYTGVSAAEQCDYNGGTGYCAIGNGSTTPMCNGSAEWQGVVVFTDTTNSYVAQCCGNGTTGNYAVKSCNTAINTDPTDCSGGYESACGCGGSNKCKPCGSPVSYNAYCSVTASGDSECHNYGCATGQTDCSGTCTNLSTDNYNCGRCGNVCTGGDTCQSGSCSLDCGPTCFLNEDNCCQSNTGCFAAGTQITMADGATRAIETLQVGDYVLAYDTLLGRAMPSRVTKTFVHQNEGGMVLVNGTVRATPNHPFYANGKWVRADELNSGDVLIGLTGRVDASMATLDSLQSMPAVETVYNLEVDTLHDYFAGGVLVHNKLPVCNCEQY